VSLDSLDTQHPSDEEHIRNFRNKETRGSRGIVERVSEMVNLAHPLMKSQFDFKRTYL
jgi:hypothetical protein